MEWQIAPPPLAPRRTVPQPRPQQQFNPQNHHKTKNEQRGSLLLDVSLRLDDGEIQNIYAEDPHQQRSSFLGFHHQVENRQEGHLVAGETTTTSRKKDTDDEEVHHQSASSSSTTDLHKHKIQISDQQKPTSSRSPDPSTTKPQKGNPRTRKEETTKHSALHELNSSDLEKKPLSQPHRKATLKDGEKGTTNNPSKTPTNSSNSKTPQEKHKEQKNAVHSKLTTTRPPQVYNGGGMKKDTLQPRHQQNSKAILRKEIHREGDSFSPVPGTSSPRITRNMGAPLVDRERAPLSRPALNSTLPLQRKIQALQRESLLDEEENQEGGRPMKGQTASQPQTKAPNSLLNVRQEEKIFHDLVSLDVESNEDPTMKQRYLHPIPSKHRETTSRNGLADQHRAPQPHIFDGIPPDFLQREAALEVFFPKQTAIYSSEDQAAIGKEFDSYDEQSIECVDLYSYLKACGFYDH